MDTIRGWVIFCFLTAAAVLAFLGWQSWEKYALEQGAAETLEEASALIQEVEKEPELTAFEEEYSDARKSFQTGRQRLAEEDFETALASARRSVNLLSSILSALRDQSSAGEAQIISMGGRVEVKRGELGDWENARTRTSLRDGNYVRTSRTGSAEIMFVDGTLYRVRPNTLFLVSSRYSAAGKEQQAIRMEYGWVDLSTKNPSLVETPDAEAEIRQDSSASVAYDRTSKAARFSAYQGSMNVKTASGSSLELGALEEVRQEEGALSEAYPLPAAPRLLSPPENLERTDRGELVLAWDQVDNATSYALQVSRNQLFLDNIIDTDQRLKRSATISLRGEGSFVWRAAAIDKDGRRGPWSVPRRFRVSLIEEGSRSSGLQDREPPRLALNQVQPYGSLFIISGQTEPGAVVSVGDELVTVDADGTFSKTLQVHDRGWNFVEIRARDAYGNEEKLPLRLYVDTL